MGKINLSSVQSERAVAPPSFVLSPQQAEVLRWVRDESGNALLVAVAGSGKTSTLVEICKYLDNAIYLAFNRSISLEVGATLAQAGIGREVKSSTFHAVGFQAWVRRAPRCRNNVKGEKLQILAEKIFLPKHLLAFCTKLVSLAKQSLIGVDCAIDDEQPWLDLIEHFDLLDLIPQGDEDLDEEEIVDTGLAWSLRLLRSSIQESDTMIDFDDMLYMPLYAKLRFWQYKWVLIDEAQDTNKARRMIAEQLLAPGGRLIAVGDPHQAIYGFTGADADALELIASTFQCRELPLTVSWRCPKSVVAHAQQYVSHIEAAPSAAEGRVTFLEDADFQKIIPMAGTAIICRNVKPIVKLAFSYLRRHIPCAIEGRDVGQGLLTLSRKWKTAQNLGELAVRLQDYMIKEEERLLAQHKEAQVGTMRDKVETLLVLIDSLGDDQPLDALRELINRLFADSEPGQPQRKIILSTIHKAKGREWDTVYLYGRNALMPSPFATQEWQLVQENNLAYVAITRAKQELIEVNIPKRR